MLEGSKTEDYQLLREVVDQGPRELGYSGEDLNVELVASDKQHVLDLCSSKGQSCCYKFYWPSFRMAYRKPRSSELGKILTKVAMEGSRMFLCSPDQGVHGGTEYCRSVWEKLTMTSTQLPDDASHVLLGRKTPIRKPEPGSMLSVVVGSPAPVSWEDLNSALVQEMKRDRRGYTLDVLKDQLRPRDAVDATPGGDEYVGLDAVAPNTPCHVPNPNVV